MTQPSLRVAATCGFAMLSLTACGDATPELPTTLESVAFDTVFSLGAASGASWEVFDGIWDVEVDANGLLAVLDLGGPVVYIYDGKGGHVGSIDATGLEEGQLDGPAAIAWAAPGTLVVWDPGSSWVSTFSVDGSNVEYVDRWRAFAFGETGFCAQRSRSYLSYWQDGNSVHEVGPDGIVGSFGPAPAVAGGESLGPELLEIAVEELTPSALLCTAAGVLDVGFVQSIVRLHDWEGTELWSRPFDDFRPVIAYSDDGIGLGRAFDAGGSQLLRSVVPWGDGMVLVQHELRAREFPEQGDVEVFESRLLRLADGVEVDRSRTFPLVLGAAGSRLYLAADGAVARITAVEIR